MKEQAIQWRGPGFTRVPYVKVAGKLLLAERVAVCDSTVTDTLLVLPL